MDRTVNSMKLSKRATGALLLAVGAGVVATQGAAAAAPMSSQDVAALEDGLSTGTVPFTVPLSAPTSRLPVLAEGGEISGAIPTSPLMPPVPQDKPTLLPEQVVPALSSGSVGPALKTTLPLPAAAEGITPAPSAWTPPRRRCTRPARPSNSVSRSSTSTTTAESSRTARCPSGSSTPGW